MLRSPATGKEAHAGARQWIGRSFPAANNAVSQLVEAGVLNQVTTGRRNRVYEAPEIIAAFTDLEPARQS